MAAWSASWMRPDQRTAPRSEGRRRLPMASMGLARSSVGKKTTLKRCPARVMVRWAPSSASAASRCSSAKTRRSAAAFTSRTLTPARGVRQVGHARKARRSSCALQAAQTTCPQGNADGSVTGSKHTGHGSLPAGAPSDAPRARLLRRGRAIVRPRADAAGPLPRAAARRVLGDLQPRQERGLRLLFPGIDRPDAIYGAAGARAR